MRHGKKFNHLGRKTAHRKALLRNLGISLIEHKRIETTLAKAKALRKFIEPIVTKGKVNTMHSRRVVFSYLQNKEAVKELFSTVADKIGDRPGGYVRVIKTGFRRSDGAEMAMIEFARNTLKMKKAGSSELDRNCFPVIGLIDEWNKDGKIIKGTDKNLGGTMRLGLYEAKLRNNSAIKNIYKSSMIKERHRHRYEVNINLIQKFEKKGLMFSGISPDNKLPEIIELKNHPWFIGVQFHPEFKSRPLNPHPLFSSFIKAAKSFNGK